MFFIINHMPWKMCTFQYSKSSSRHHHLAWMGLKGSSIGCSGFVLMTYSFFINDCFADLLFLPLSWIWYSQVQSKAHFVCLKCINEKTLFTCSEPYFQKNLKILIGYFMISSVWINGDTRVSTLLHPPIITFCWLIKKII